MTGGWGGGGRDKYGGVWGREYDEQGRGGGGGGHGYLALCGLPPGQVGLRGPVIELMQPLGLLQLAQRPLLLASLPALSQLPRQVHGAPPQAPGHQSGHDTHTRR